MVSPHGTRAQVARAKPLAL